MWRLLKVGDIVEATDQTFQSQLGWLVVGEHTPSAVCMSVTDNIALTIPIRRKISEQGEAVQTSTQHAKVNMTRLKELRDQSVSLMDQKEPIGSAYVYEIVNEFIKSAGE